MNPLLEYTVEEIKKTLRKKMFILITVLYTAMLFLIPFQSLLPSPRSFVIQASVVDLVNSSESVDLVATIGERQGINFSFSGEFEKKLYVTNDRSEAPVLENATILELSNASMTTAKTLLVKDALEAYDSLILVVPLTRPIDPVLEAGEKNDRIALMHSRLEWSIGRAENQIQNIVSTLISILFPLLILFAIFAGGNFVSESIAEEKDRKTIEILASSPLSYTEILVGKILSITLLLLFQINLWAFILNALIGGGLELLEISIFCLPSILFFTSLGVGVSSVSKNFEEARNAYGMFMFPIVAVLLLPILPQSIRDFLIYLPIFASYSTIVLVAQQSGVSLLSLRGLLLFSSNLLGSLIIVAIASKIFRKRII